MSARNVEERVVQMQFDNAQFEARAQNTISTLNSLTAALQLPSSSKGLDEIQSKVRNVDFSRLSDAIDTVNYRFSTLGIVATNVLTRITNSILDTARNLVTSITTKPMMDGFSEYEEKMDSIKRILNSAKDADGLPVTLEAVNKKLDELNTYSDKTIYSFRDMTNNIGKFTNAGVDLDTAVLAIQGIANEAALAGANSQEASRAMYNFAQALSVGYIQKVDWRSIELANMATVGFKEALIDTALELETVKKVGDDYVTTTTDMRGKTSDAMGAMQLFSDGLSYQWLTTDVLIETLKRYSNEEDELGKAAFRAATEVTTFSMLLQTLKEALGSGWAQTWQLVIGDFGEAKELWTSVNNVLSDMINTSAEARNKLISDWDVLGGRKAVLDGLTDAWGGLTNIAREAGWAFERVLPAIDGFDLVNLSLAVRNAGKSFRQFTGAMGPHMSAIFEAAASAIDLVGQAISAVRRTLKPFIPDVGGLFSELLTHISPVARAFTNWVKSLRETDAIYNGLQRIVGVFQAVGQKITEVRDKLFDLLGIDKELLKMPLSEIFATKFNFGDDMGNLSKLDKVKAFFQGFGDAVRNFISAVGNSEGLKSLAEGISSLAESVGKIAGSFGKAVFGALEKIAGGLGDFLKGGANVGFNLEDVFNIGIFGGVVVLFKKLVDKLKGPTKSFGEILGGLKRFLEIPKAFGKTIGDLIDAITGPLKELQTAIKAEALLKIAGAIAILAISLIALSTVESGDLAVALLGLGVLLKELTSVFESFSEIAGEADSKKLKSASVSLIAFSVAILILSKSVKDLATLSVGDLVKGVLAVGALSLMMAMLGKIDSNGVNAKGLIGMSVAILIIQKAVSALGSLDEDQLRNGLLSVGILMTLMALISKFGDNNFSSKGLIGMSAAILILQVAVKRLGELDDRVLAKGAGVVAAFMVLFGAISKLGGKNVSGFTFVLMAASVVMLQKVIEAFAGIDEGPLRVGVEAVGILLGIMTAMSVLGKSNIGGAATMIGMAVAMKLLQGVVKEFSGIPMVGLAQGIIAIGVALAEMVLAANAMKGALGGAAAMIVMAAALNMLVPVIKTLGTLPFNAILQSLASMALTFALLYAAGIVLGSLAGDLLAVSGALALFGVSLIAVGAGLLAVTAGLGAFIVMLSASAPALISALSVLIEGIVGLRPLLIKAVLDGIIEVLGSIGDMAGAFVETVIKIGLLVIQALEQLALPLGEAVLKVLIFLIDLLAEYFPTLTNSLVNLLITMLDGLAMAIYNNTDKFIAATRHVLGAIADFILAFLQEILRGIPGVGGQISDALQGVRDDIAKEMSRETGAKIGADHIDGVAEGATSKAEELRQAGTEVGAAGQDGVLAGLSTLAPDVGSLFGSTIPGAISDSTGESEAAASGVASSIMGALTEDLTGTTDIGAYLDQGLANGITDNSYLTDGATSELTSGLLEGLNSNLGVSSPSTMTWETGMYLDQGLANGLAENSGLISAAIDGLGSFVTGIFSSLRATFSKSGTENGRAFAQGVSGTSNVAKASGTTVATSASSAIAATRTTFLQNGMVSGTSYSTGVSSKRNESRAAGVIVGASAVTGLGTARPAFSSAGMSSGSSYATGVSSKKSSARSAGQDISNSAVQGMKSVGGFYDAGRDSGEGYIDGLWSKAREMANAAAEVVRNALRAAKDAIDSNSPSKKYMELGADSDRGYILGVESEAKNVNKAMDKLATNAMGAFYEGISRADMLANNDFVVTPSITPVMDMTNIYGTADYLGNMFSGAGGILGTISTDINNNTTDINRLVETTGRILTALRSARPITIDGTTVIGWIDRELGALE